jgi:hypothetical protein
MGVSLIFMPLDSNPFKVARTSAAGDGLTEPLYDFIESGCRQSGRRSYRGTLFCAQ